jgi:type I restriction enzyme S subunit
MRKFPLVPLTEMVDIHDYLREPISQTVRNKRVGPFPYYGATGQVGWIDAYRQDGKYVLLGEDGAPFLDAEKTKAYIVEGKCWVNNHAHVLKGKEGICDDDFLCFALNWADYTEAVTGSTRLKLPQNTMNRLLIPKPRIDQQRLIASRLKGQLDEVEVARKAAGTQLRDSRLLRSRTLTEFFAELADTPTKRLGDYAATTSGSTPSRSNKRYWQPAEVPWIKTGEVAFAPITTAEEAISNTALAECSLSLLPPKTILIAMYGQGKTRGQSAILEMDATINQACFAVLPNETWEPEFLYLWLKASYQDLRDLSDDRGGNQANLNGALLKALKVPAPSKPEQQQLVARVQAAMLELDALESSSKTALEDIIRLPRRVLAQAFEG